MFLSVCTCIRVCVCVCVYVNVFVYVCANVCVCVCVCMLMPTLCIYCIWAPHYYGLTRECEPFSILCHFCEDHVYLQIGEDIKVKCRCVSVLLFWCNAGLMMRKVGIEIRCRN